MLDTVFAVSEKQLVHQGRRVTIKSAGIQNGRPYVEVDPPDDRVVQVFTRHIDRVIRGDEPTISLDEIQADLIQADLQ